MSDPAVRIREAGPDDAAGVAAVLNGVIRGGSPTLLDTIARFAQPGEDDHIGCAGTLRGWCDGGKVGNNGAVVSRPAGIPWRRYSSAMCALATTIEA